MNLTGILFVGLGGGLGAICRYGLSSILVKSNYPLMTFLVNVLGCVLIGFVMGLSSRDKLGSNAVSFLKTGFCGGFTTFSTFSLETYTLLQKKNYAIAAAYIGLSVLCCILGVWLGQLLARKLHTA